MKHFKIKFPSGYQVNDIFNDNIDLHIVLPDNRVFFGTAFTILNIQNLMKKGQSCYFWSTDMILLTDLKIFTIVKAIEETINEGFFELIFSEIGFLDILYSKNTNYDDLIDEGVTAI